MLEAALELHELLDRQLFLRHIVQMPFAVDDLVQRPDAGLDCHFADLGEHLGRILPAARTRRHDIDERRTFGVDRAVRFFVEVLEVAEKSGLGNIRDVVRRHDLGQILLVLLLADRAGAGRRGGRARKARRRGRALNAGVHVRLVVVAEIYHVVTALHRAGERLEADVVGAAVAADGEELVGIVDPALALEDIVSRLDAAAGRRCILEGRMDVGVLPCGERIQEGGNLKAGGRVADDRLVALIERAHHAAADQTCAAACTQTVAADETLRLGKFNFMIICHFRTPPVRCCADPCGYTSDPCRRCSRAGTGGQIRARCRRSQRRGRPDRKRY